MKRPILIGLIPGLLGLGFFAGGCGERPVEGDNPAAASGRDAEDAVSAERRAERAGSGARSRPGAAGHSPR
jgi:hypothetical protein